MTPDEYALSVEDPDALDFIIAAHRSGRTILEEVLRTNLHRAVGSDDHRPASRILARLRATGRA